MQNLNSFNVRYLQALFFLCVGLTLAFAFSISHFLIGLAIYPFLIVLGVNIGLHRGLSHKQLQFESGFFKLATTLGSICCLGRPIDWAVVHRLHHKYSDTELDPHSPAGQGRWRILTNSWRLSGNISQSEKLSLARDLASSRWLRFLQRNYISLILVVCALMTLITGWQGLVYFYFLPVCLCFSATSLVNGYCHSKSGTTKDSWWINYFALGEGLHHSHHEKPGRIDHSRPFYLDLTGKVLKWNCRLR